MLLFLPATLIALIFSPVFSQQVSKNDPFKVISLNAPKPDRMVCDLRVSTPSEPVDDEVLLSFEEWKKRQLGIHSEPPKDVDRVNGNQTSLAVARGHVTSIGSDNATAVLDTNASAGYYYLTGIHSSSELAPHFRVPITDRFNYANLDCSARVHVSHRSAKSASSILSSKKDRYMLSPCNTRKEKQFVVVELCDDIRIDTVQLANFEFFSGVFKDFTVSVAKTYTTDPDGWTFAGTYRAKNVRGVQSFHPPTSLRDFYRFIRIDFLSNYGNEYYCPISILRVYGLTHLEEWKWDTWQAESKTKLEKTGQPVISPIEVKPASSVQVSVAASTDGQQSDNMEASVFAGHSGIPVTPSISDSSRTAAFIETTSPESDSAGIYSTPVIPSENHLSAIPPSEPSPSPPIDGSTTLGTTSYILESQHVGLGESSSNSTSRFDARGHEQQSESLSSSPTFTASSSSTYPGPSVIHSHPVVSPPASGESIYRTIMNRLTAVENNQTLYMKYVEQQNGAMRDVIKRLGEDLGRLEGMIRVQSAGFQRTVNDWENQRYQLQMEYGYISRRVEDLSEEIILEKRLSIAQLCLLLAVLVFLGLTRGSRANEGITVRHKSSEGLREWGRRHLSWTGDYWSGGSKDWEHKDYLNGRGRGIDQTRRNDNRSRGKAINRPSPLDLKPFGNSILSKPFQDDLDVVSDTDKNLPFPSSEPPLQQFKPMTAVTPRRRTRSNPRCLSSGTATPLRSAPVLNIPGHRLRVTQRSRTPTSRSHILFRTPHALQRSHSLTQTTGNLEMGRASLKLPTPMLPSSSWAGSVAPRSAKRWARTAHLHEVKKGSKKQENIGVGRGMEDKTLRVKGKVRDGQAQSMDADDDFFTIRPERHPLSMTMRLLNAQGGPSSKTNDSVVDYAEVGQSQAGGLVYSPGLGTSDGAGFLNSTRQDESDPWVDTDSASGEEVSDILSSSNPPRRTLDGDTVGG